MKWLVAEPTSPQAGDIEAQAGSPPSIFRISIEPKSPHGQRGTRDGRMALRTPAGVVTKYDPALASPFRMDWLVDDIDKTSRDDLTRAIAEKAASILRSARFVGMHAQHQDTDIEVRVWVEAAAMNACVSVTWEPGAGRYGFHLLDDTLRERLACVVFENVPSLDADGSASQVGTVVDALRGARRLEINAPDVDLGVER